MKHNFLTFILILIFSNSYSQSMLDHEREVQNPEQYNIEEIEFENIEEEFKLSGTLISPKTDYEKIIIIVPGTGQDGRNSHFKLVDSLLQNNIAVYRYDERGFGKSEGKYFPLYLFSGIRKFNDVYYCVENLKANPSLSGKKIGILGHSEGGMASIEAMKQGAQIDFLIQLAAPIKPYEILRYQFQKGSNPYFFNSLKFSDSKKIEFIDLVNSTIQNNKEEKYNEIRKIIKKEAKLIGFSFSEYKKYLSNSLFLNLLKKDYEDFYLKASIPILYIIGEKDEMVDPIRNIEIIKNLENKNIEFYIAKDLYHMLTKEKFTEPGPTVYLMDEKPIMSIVSWLSN